MKKILRFLGMAVLIAVQGNAIAQNNLGCYENGHGVDKSNTDAVKWWKPAAEQGDAEAQYSFGICYLLGLGVDKSYTEAVKWYRRAAAQGNADAQYSLGHCYENGHGVPESESEAIKWYKMSAKQGYEFAIDNLKSRGIYKYD